MNTILKYNVERELEFEKPKGLLKTKLFNSYNAGW
jgi:hypothetical protein